MLIVLIYWQPGRIGTFIVDLNEALHSLLVHHQTVLLVDFNIDQRSLGNLGVLAPLLQEYDFIEGSKITTHIDGAILDLLPNNDSSVNPALRIVTPFSDRFIVSADI